MKWKGLGTHQALPIPIFYAVYTFFTFWYFNGFGFQMSFALTIDLRDVVRHLVRLSRKSEETNCLIVKSK